MVQTGLFIGLITLDFIYLAPAPPQANQKLVAIDNTIAAGGPATNAAITFGYLGGQSTILGALGNHAIAQLIQTDIERSQVILKDLTPQITNSPPVSSIIVTQATGERAVISLNAVKAQVSVNSIPSDIYTQLANHDYSVMLVDGHQIEVSRELTKIAQTQNIPVVLDGGSWKPGLESLLGNINYAVCSSNFYPPSCNTSQDVFNFLREYNIPHIAITRGEKPILYLEANQVQQIPVPAIQAVDTLGAGDIFHGAFTRYILDRIFPDSLATAAQVAAKSCGYFGTRRWMAG